MNERILYKTSAKPFFEFAQDFSSVFKSAGRLQVLNTALLDIIVGWLLSENACHTVKKIPIHPTCDITTLTTSMDITRHCFSCILLFIHSFILETYIAPLYSSRDYFSEVLPAQSWPKKKD